MANKSPLQDQLLNYLRKKKVRTSLFLVNGVKLQGVVSSFDVFCVLLSDGERRQLVYKSAISTVAPGEPITFGPDGLEDVCTSSED